jgi:stage II sporulation protein D
MHLLAALLLSTSALAPGPPVRVGVLSLLEPQRLEVVAPGAALALPGGAVLEPGRLLRITRDGTRVAASTGDGWRWGGGALRIGEPGAELHVDVIGRDRRSRVLDGPLEVEVAGGSLRVIFEADMEDLVASAVAAELEQVEDAAALEAAAVVLRSYVAAGAARHGSEGFDLCDTTHCLVSRGAPAADTAAARAARDAARATRGLVLRYAGRTIAGYCTACCGGATATPGALWGGGDDGYSGVTCTACSGSKYFRWRRTSSLSDVHASLEALLGRRVGAAAELAVVPGAGGWARWLTVRDGNRDARVGGEAFRMALGRRLGWDALPSSRFSLARAGGGYEFRGSGHGHGVGLCLAGAVARARAGATRGEILRHYFPRCEVADLGVARGHWRRAGGPV